VLQLQLKKTSREKGKVLSILKGLDGILSKSGSVLRNLNFCAHSTTAEKIMFCFVSALYCTEDKKFVDNAQQCFAFAPCVQFKPKFKC
jgi:hypothetical protein